MKLLKTAFRSLWKFRLYTVINIVGLAVSLGCVILIARYVHQEATVNHFVDDLGRAYMTVIEELNGQTRYGAVLEGQSELLNDPLIERRTSFLAIEEDHVLLDDHKVNVKVLGADSLFLKILPYPVLYGSGRMNAPEDILLTRRLAKKLFGDENPVGKTITYSSGEELKVVGVLDEPSSKSFLDFDLLLNKDQRMFRAMTGYDIAVLHQNGDIDLLNARYADYTPIPQIGRREGRFQLVPLKEFYFDKSRIVPTGISRGAIAPVFIRGNSSTVYVLLLVGILILLVGLFNFINIYTLITLRREREFSVKKIYGAAKWRIFCQIYIENLMMTLLAVFGAWFFMEVTGTLLAERLAFVVRPNLRFDVMVSVIVVVCLSALTSLFPYLRYCYSLPITSLRSMNAGKSSLALRSLFLSLQYVITFALLVIALFFVKQLNYMLDADPGYKTQDVIVSRMMQRNFNMDFSRIDDQVALVERRMNESPLFSDWVFGKPVYNLNAATRVRVVGGDDFQSINFLRLSPAYIRMFGFQLKEGRLWNDTDKGDQQRCILNESAKRVFHIKDIRDTRLEMEHRVMGDDPEEGDSSYEVVGVIADFQTGHLSKQTVPLVITYEEKGFHFEHLMARFVDGREEEAVAYLEALYKEINNNAEFSYSLLEEEIASLYEDDRRITRVYTLFAVIAILVSCLGLFTLSLFDIRQRYREIALRKVNGAGTNDILELLLKKYLLLLGGAFAVAVPVSYLFISRYLENFAMKASVSWWLFAISAVVVAGVSLLTLVWQVKRASRINPAEVLKS